jgi:predicted small lipoprotein YifL
MTKYWPRSRHGIALTTAGLVVGFALSGCGEKAPPPMTPEAFNTAKEEREEIIQKEYGAAAYNKAVKSGKAGIK